MRKREPQPGDTMFRVFNEDVGGGSQSVTVESVGPKYVTFKERWVPQVDKLMMRDGNSVFWASEEDYNDYIERLEAWRRLRLFVLDRQHPIAGVHLQTIKMAHELLQTITPGLVD